MSIPSPEVLRELMNSTSLVELVSTSPMESPFQAALRRASEHPAFNTVSTVSKSCEPFVWPGAGAHPNAMSKIYIEPETDELRIQIIPPGEWINPDVKACWFDADGKLVEVY